MVNRALIQLLNDHVGSTDHGEAFQAVSEYGDVIMIHKDLTDKLVLTVDQGQGENVLHWALERIST